MSTHDTGPPAQESPPARQVMTTKLTVIPAVFKDPERAAAEMVEAKRALDAATTRLRERERANAEERAKRVHIRQGGVDQEYEIHKTQLEPLVVAVERARAEFEVAFAIYQETARARDAKSNNAVAATNATVSKRIAWITLVVAIAAAAQTVAMVVQVVHTWSARP